MYKPGISEFLNLLCAFGMLGCVPLRGASAPVPCSMLTAKDSRFCVFVGATNGYLTIIGTGELHTKPGFSFGKYNTKEAVEAQLNVYVAALLHKQRLYEIDLPMPGHGATPPVPPGAKTISGKTMNEAVEKLKQAWPDCHECDLLIKNALHKRLSDLNMSSETPFFGETAETDNNILAFDVDPPSAGLSDAAHLAIGFDMGATALDKDGRLETGAAVREWTTTQYEGRFWIASEISNHFNDLYRAVGLNSNVFVSLAGKARSITITESSRIGRVIFPGDAQSKIDPAADKLAYLLLRTDQWKAFPGSAKLTAQSGGSGFILCLPTLSGGACTPANTTDPQQALLPDGDGVQRSLDYLSTFWLAERVADLQPLGYSVAASSEPSPPLDPAHPNLVRTAAVDLNVQKLASATNSSPAPQPSAPQPSVPAQTESAPETTGDMATAKVGPASVSGAPRQPGVHNAFEPSGLNQMGFSGPKVVPAPPGTTPPPAKDWVAEYGAGVQYRPNQAVRILLAAQTRTLRIGPALFSASGQAGTDGTRPLGNGNVNADWLWFDRIRRRLQFQLTGSTDATSKRILSGAYTDERRTGGNAHLDLELFRDNRGFLWHIFGDPRHDTVTLTRAGIAAGGGNIGTLTIGSGIVMNQWITESPTRIALNVQTRIGAGIGAGAPVYNVFDVNGGLHRRISNHYLISVDVSGRLDLASAQTPVFELPSLGGAESVRGFQMDDALGRKTWNLQNELWAPVPGTLNATEAKGILWFLRQNVRLAGFLDLGGAWDTSLAHSPGLAAAGVSSQEGFRRGSGAGVRFIQGPITLKLDWAYGFGQGAFGPGHGRFYLGVGTNGSF